MRTSHASQSPRTQTQDTIEVNGYSSEEPEEEEEEEDPEEEVEEDPEELNEDLEEEDPSEEYASQPCSESDTSETDHNDSNEKNRSGDSMAFGSTVDQPQKKTNYNEVHRESGNQRRSRWDPQPEQEGGSSGKRRRSRWDSHPDQDGKTGDGSSRKRKTRWASDDDSKLKILGPLQLPDFKTDAVGSHLDPETRVLQARLIEINKKLQRSELQDERPEGERSPSPQPIYNNLGIRINTREVRMRQKLTEERHVIISNMINKNPTFKHPTENVQKKLSKKVYVPVKEYPDYNFIGLIIGPRGNTQKRLEKETGALIKLRGKGSMRKTSKLFDPSDNDELHVYIESSKQNSLDKAVAMVEKLLIPFPLENNEHKRAQLEELARLQVTCNVCKEKGHKAYVCPQRQSGLHTAIQNPQNKLSDNAKLYVGYLPHSIDDNHLRELFSPFGKIISACVIMDRTTGLNKGYGFVNFENPVEAAGAVAHMNGYQMDGNRLAVRVAGRPPGAGPTAVAPPPRSFPWVGAQHSFPISQLPNFRAPQFPGDPDYRGSNPSLGAQFPGDPYYVSSSPSFGAQFPGDPDYVGSSSFMHFNHSPSQFPR